MGFSKAAIEHLKKNEELEYAARLKKINENISRMKQAGQSDNQDVSEARPAIAITDNLLIDSSNHISGALSVLVSIFLKKNNLSEEEIKRQLKEERARLAKRDQVNFDRVHESMIRIRERNKPRYSQKDIDAAKHTPVRKQIDSDRSKIGM